MEEDAVRVSDGDAMMTGDEEYVCHVPIRFPAMLTRDRNAAVVRDNEGEGAVDDSLPLDPALFES